MTDPAQGVGLHSGQRSGHQAGRADRETLGEFLRRHREANGITLERLSAVTKIKQRILVAIEEDRFDDTPPAPLLRGFLKGIAQELGLAPAQVLARYEEMGVRAELERIFPEWSAGLEVPRRSGFNWLAGAVVIFIAAGVAVLFYADGWIQRRGETPRSPRERKLSPAGPGVSLPGTPRKAEEARVVASREGPDRTLRRDSLSARASDQPPAAGNTGGTSVEVAGTNGSGVELSVRKQGAAGKADAGPLTLKITAMEDTWLRVVVDGKRRHDLFLTEGESRNWRGDKSFVLTVGNASSTRVELNGLVVQLPKTRSNLVRDFLVGKKNLP